MPAEDSLRIRFFFCQSTFVPDITAGGKQGAASGTFFSSLDGIQSRGSDCMKFTKDVGRFAAQKYITQGSLYGPILPAPAETARLTGLSADPERPYQIRRDVMFRSPWPWAVSAFAHRLAGSDLIIR